MQDGASSFQRKKESFGLKSLNVDKMLRYEYEMKSAFGELIVVSRETDHSLGFVSLLIKG